MTDDTPRPVASPPCLAHELAFDGEGFVVVDEQQRRDVARWRTSERKRLIESRLGVAPETRRNWSARILDRVVAAAGPLGGRTVSLYWPIRGEPDLRPLADRIVAAGAVPALPVVVEKARPLRFRVWRPGDPLEKGVWNIAVPAAGAPVVPDVALAPVVGFDAACFRLGYGGGYFDRTLAAMTPRPHVIGVGFAMQRIATIFPQPHDVAMDAIVTEDATLLPDNGAGEGGEPAFTG